MSLKQLALTAALAAAALPASAALTYTATGSYNLGSASGPGGTAASTSSCGLNSGQDALEFTGAGVNNIGIHAYACDDAASNFGSRSSGESTFFAQGMASVSGTLTTSDLGGFSFYINPGEVGAFGSSAFTAAEFQRAMLTIKLIIDGTVYMDEAWSAEVGAGGAITSSYESHGSQTVNWVSTAGDGYFSYGLAGGYYALDLADGEHDISYVMTSTAYGNISSTGVCTAVLYDQVGGPQRGAGTAAAEGPAAGDPFTAYCGAGARSGDPFPADPIARALQLEQVPEPMSMALALTALLAAAGTGRRKR